MAWRQTIVGILVLTAVWMGTGENVSKVATALEQHLRALIVNPSSKNGVQLEILTRSPADADQGRFQLISISSAPAQIKGVFLREFRGRVVDAVIDVPALLQRGKLRTLRAQESVVDGILDGEALEKMFALGKSTKPMKIKVEVLDGVVKLTGVLTLIGINNPFEALCRVVPSPEGLNVIIDELRVNGIPAPAIIRSRLEKKINPVVNRDEIPFSPEFRSIRFKDGLIYVSSKRDENPRR
ncbi:MAG: hypothetical protein NZ959_09480 [Armatimonadetes bacterium]|nr:hypothetical protein [Armatimonadota bacterium]MDW8122182.1 hypothetical protein [Armatimonadota bacterium]